MLGAVIHIHSAQRFDQGDAEDIQDENGDADAALDEVEPKSLHPRRPKTRQLRERLRHQHEDENGENDAEDCRRSVQEGVEVDFMLFREPFFRFGGLFVVPFRHFGAAHQHAVAHDEGIDEIHHAAHKGQAGKTAALFGGRQAFRLHLNVAFAVAHRRRHRALAPHHDALHPRLTADIRAGFSRFRFCLFSFLCIFHRDILYAAAKPAIFIFSNAARRSRAAL